MDKTQVKHKVYYRSYLSGALVFFVSIEIRQIIFLSIENSLKILRYQRGNQNL